MRLKSLVYFMENSEAEDPFFCYRGAFVEEFTSVILEISEGSKLTNQALPGITRKMSFMLVECFQNVLKHGESNYKGDFERNHDGLFSFKNTPEAFYINSINVIRKHDVQKLVQLMEQVNAMNEADLREFYLLNLENNELSSKGGAGLGLIELARKSKEKIAFRFEDLNNEFALFHQQVTMKHLPLDDLVLEKMITKTSRFYKKLIEENILLQYKGDFSQRSILPLLNMMEKNVSADAATSRTCKRAGHILIEVLQNISKHSVGENNQRRDGIFLMGMDDIGVFICAGNNVSIAEKLFLEESLEYLVKLDKEELRELHRTTLRSSLRFESKSKTGLGLIEIAQASSRRIHYEFFPSGYNKFLFTIQISV
jgi:hypothetical protein